MKLLMLKGLPASGKSTYAKKLSDDGWVRVNKDDLRAMLHNGKWSKTNEQQVLKLRDEIIANSLRLGKSVVVDDTNLATKHAARLKELAKEFNATFETKFFDTSVEECIKRDLGRLNSVGEKVIRDMHRQFLASQPQAYVPPSNAPRAILCDIDGTLALMGERSPFEWGKVGIDTVETVIADIVNTYHDLPDIEVVLMSGRDAVCLPETTQWLKDNDIKYDKLLMRPEGDNRKDSIIKRELFDLHVRDNYNVLFVLDDRNQVVDMWREMGLKCLQVAPGDF
jgi:predicted kinase